MKITQEEVNIAVKNHILYSNTPEEMQSQVKTAFICGVNFVLSKQQQPKTIREMRLELKMTMREVAKACGTNTYYIPQIENGTKGKRSQTGTGTTYKRVYEYLQNKLNEQK